jgi:hypothetical protein
MVSLFGALEKTVRDVFQRFSITSYLVWGRVVPDIPPFCRERRYELAEQ